MEKKVTVYLRDCTPAYKFVIWVLALFSSFCLYIITEENIVILALFFIGTGLLTLFMLKNEDCGLEKITVTKNEVIITVYSKKNKTFSFGKNYFDKIKETLTSNKKKIIKYNKSSIERFHAEFYSSNHKDMLNKNTYYYAYITINDNYYTCSSSSCAIVKSIFKIAKYIPNFSYSVDPECTPIPLEEINKIAKQGRSLNIIDFIKLVYTDSPISNLVKIGISLRILLVLLTILFLIVTISSTEFQLQNSNVINTIQYIIGGALMFVAILAALYTKY